MVVTGGRAPRSAVLVTLNGSGSATSESSANTTAIGKYCWRAEYSGDGFYNSSTHTNATTECFTTVGQPSQTATQSTPSSSTVVPGTSVSDAATVTPVVAGQQTATGSVKFFLCQPAQVTAGGCEGVAGTQVGGAVTLNGSGQATSASSSNTTAIGKYCWRAVYSGDSFYNGSSHTNAASECFTTVKQPSQTATQCVAGSSTVVPGTSASDTATITGSGPTPTGSVTFFLCRPVWR